MEPPLLWMKPPEPGRGGQGRQAGHVSQDPTAGGSWGRGAASPGLLEMRTS